MAAITVTNVAGARIILPNGKERRLFTGTSSGSADTIDVSAYFEAVHSCRAWDSTDGTDAEAYVAGADYAADDITINGSQVNALYIDVIGTSIKSTGGAT